MEAKLYIAQENFEFRGVKRVKGDILRITDEKAEGLGEKVEVSDDQSASPSSPKAPASSPESSPKAPKEDKENPASLPNNMPEDDVKNNEEGETKEADTSEEPTSEDKPEETSGE